MIALRLISILLAQAGSPAPAADAAAAEAAALQAQDVDVVVVTGTRTERRRADSTALVNVIDRSEIEASGAETIATVLEAQPGIELTPGLRGFSVRMQGLDPEYVLVLVDGERVQGRLGGAIDLTRLPADSVERVEIVKGAGSALYGADAVAGVINIITRRPTQDVEVGGHFSGGSSETLDTSARLGLRRRSYEVLAIAGHHRGAGWDLTPSTPATTASAFRATDLTLSGGWWATSQLRLGAKADYIIRNQTGVGSSETGAIFDRETQSEQASITLEPDWRFGDGHRLRVTGHHGFFKDQFLSDQRNSDALDQLQKTSEQATRAGAQLDLALHPRHALTTGTEVLVEQMESPRLASMTATRTRFALFAQHEWQMAQKPRLALLPGVRFDADTQFGSHVSPKLALRWDPHQNVALRTAYGLGYRAPSFQELYLAFDNPGVGYMVAGNVDLQPEQSRSFNFDVEWRATKWFRGTLGLFHTKIDNLIITRLRNPGAIGVPSLYSYDNVAAAHTQGIEAGVGVDIGKGVRADIGYTLTAARDDEEDRALEGRARHRATARLFYRHDKAGFSGSVRATLVGRRPFYVDTNQDDVLETDHAKPYATVGVRFAQVLWRKVQAFAGVENLLGAGDESYLPIAPRRYYGGLDLRY